MNELRYSELKYNGETYTEQWKIDEILIKNKFNWMVNAEIKNARLEIFNTTLVWNGGIWYNGDWYFGVWRDGEWRYGTWQNGVFYNGTWKNGTFKSGIIYNGHFFKGKILGGEIRGGQFIDVEISEGVIEYNNDEIITQQEEQAPAQPDTVKVHTQPSNEKKIIKNFDMFIEHRYYKHSELIIKKIANNTYDISIDDLYVGQITSKSDNKSIIRNIAENLVKTKNQLPIDNVMVTRFI
jgi:hypothetical protein